MRPRSRFLCPMRLLHWCTAIATCLMRVLACACLCLPVLACACLCLPVLACACLCLPVLACACLCLPVLACARPVLEDEFQSVPRESVYTLSVFLYYYIYTSSHESQATTFHQGRAIAQPASHPDTYGPLKPGTVCALRGAGAGLDHAVPRPSLWLELIRCMPGAVRPL